MNRRAFLQSGVAAFAVPAVSLASPLTGDVIEAPFLHTLSEQVALPHSVMHAGDVLLITPGVGPYDDLHLLRDGRLAAVQCNFLSGGQIGVQVYGGERFYVPRDTAEELIAGRVVKRIRLEQGRWVD